MARILRKIRNVFTGWYLVATSQNSELSKSRMEECRPCVHRKAYRCGLCGCPLIAKTRVKEEKCDANKW
jgi:hypothetical protein